MDVYNVYKDTIFTFLPDSRQCTKRNFVSKIEEHFNLYKGNKDVDIKEQIVKLVLKKCHEGGNNKAWDQQQYLNFRVKITGLSARSFKLFKTTIIKCLEASDKEILENLYAVSKHLDDYPETERIYHRSTNTYTRNFKKIEPIDCYLVITKINSDLQSIISSEANRILASGEDFDVLYDCILEISKTGTEEEQASFLKIFDRQFGFLKEIPLYQDAYEEIRKNYFSLLLKMLIRNYNGKEIKRLSNETKDFRELMSDNVQKVLRNRQLKDSYK